jgi:hypothetical protein
LFAQQTAAWRALEHADLHDPEDNTPPSTWRNQCGPIRFQAIKDRFVTKNDSEQLIEWHAEMIAAFNEPGHSGHTALRRYFHSLPALETWCKSITRKVWNMNHTRHPVFDKMSALVASRTSLMPRFAPKSPRGGSVLNSITSYRANEKRSAQSTNDIQVHRAPSTRLLQRKELRRRELAISGENDEKVLSTQRGHNQRDEEEWRNFQVDAKDFDPSFASNFLSRC